jgi:hypothetical protein
VGVENGGRGGKMGRDAEEPLRIKKIKKRDRCILAPVRELDPRPHHESAAINAWG